MSPKKKSKKSKKTKSKKTEIEPIDEFTEMKSEVLNEVIENTRKEL